jgi:hypothetical protein
MHGSSSFSLLSGVQFALMFYTCSKCSNVLSYIEKRLASSGSIVSPGEKFGLAMTLNAEINEYDSRLAEDVGFKVLVHEKNEHPLVEGNGFATMPGVSTFVAVKENKVRGMIRDRGATAKKIRAEKSRKFGQIYHKIG